MSAHRPTLPTLTLIVRWLQIRLPTLAPTPAPAPLRLPPWGEGPLQHPFFQLKEEASKARRGKGTATQNYSCEFLQKVIEFLQKAIEFLQKVIEILQKVIEFLQKVGSFLQKVIKFLQKVSLASVSPPKGGAGGGLGGAGGGSLFRF